MIGLVIAALPLPSQLGCHLERLRLLPSNSSSKMSWPLGLAAGGAVAGAVVAGAWVVGGRVVRIGAGSVTRGLAANVVVGCEVVVAAVVVVMWWRRGASDTRRSLIVGGSSDAVTAAGVIATCLAVRARAGELAGTESYATGGEKCDRDGDNRDDFVRAAMRSFVKHALLIGSGVWRT